MKKKKDVALIIVGVVCIVLLLVSSWYSITFNDSRLVVPMNFSEYTFCMKDLPMICSVSLFCLYILYLSILLVKGIIKKNQNQSLNQCIQKINPKLKKKAAAIIIAGIVCIVLLFVSSWYSITFNESRLVVPMNFSEYTFCMKDLPMICSVSLLCLYIFYLCVLLIKGIIKNNKSQFSNQYTRKINPKLGYLGFLGLIGFLGFWSYGIDKTIFPFIFFMFFGFFGFFYEGKMSGTLMDEMYKENKLKASAKANKISLGIIFLSLIILGQGRIMVNLDFTLIAFVIVVALAIALEIFLNQYLLYRYDHSEQIEESEE